ncbi:MAG: hypothetical protein HC880_18125 [Bacteroidia bacterium]|nr:hypothetical protein [Bacteroidia bacterium]
MKINSAILFFFILLLMAGSPQALAQRLKKTKPLRSGETEGYVSAGFQLNALNYFGDVPADFRFTRPGIGAYLSRKLGPRIHANLTLSWGRLEGDDFSTDETSLTYARNLHFRNDILEIVTTASYDLIASYGKHQRRAPFYPHISFLGVGLIHHNPRARTPLDQGNDWIDLQPLATEGQGRPGYAKPYSKIQLVLPWDWA